MLEVAEPIKGGLFEGLIENYAPKSDRFEVVLPKGERLSFLRLTDSTAIKALAKEAADFAKSLMPKKGKVPHLIEGWESVYTPDFELLARVYIVTKLALDSDLQSQLAVLTLARKAGPIFETIVSQIDLANVNGLIQDEADTVEEEKKD